MGTRHHFIALFGSALALLLTSCARDLHRVSGSDLSYVEAAHPEVRSAKEVDGWLVWECSGVWTKWTKKAGRGILSVVYIDTDRDGRADMADGCGSDPAFGDGDEKADSDHDGYFDMLFYRDFAGEPTDVKKIHELAPLVPSGPKP